MPRTVRVMLIGSLVVAVLACGAPTAPDTSQAPTSEILAEPTPSPEPEPPIAISMSRAVSAGIRDGLWTEGEGLARSLRYLAGELSAEDVFGDQSLIAGEGTRLVRRAQVYLADPANREDRDEIARLLAILVPSREILDRFSRPAAAAMSGSGLASPRRQTGDSAVCRDLWAGGFELIENEEGELVEPICLEYVEVSVGGRTHRVYAPAYWEPDAPERDLFEPAREALIRSLEQYNAYGPDPVVGTDIVFTDIAGMEGREVPGNVLAAADEVLREDRCRVAIFPFGVELALQDGVGGDSGPEQYGVLLQTIAHELFHCYQFTNLAAQESGPSGDAADWWIEGSAEYYGSVVYPSVNAEFTQLGHLDAQSINTSLNLMDYPVYAFFEYLDAQGGMSPQGVIDDILTRMPRSGGYDEQQAAFAETPGMPEAFHAFGQVYLDKQLRDLGGGFIPVNPQMGDPTAFPVGAGEAHFSADPLVLHRYRLSFADNARFAIVREAQGDGRDSVRPASAPGAWAEIPARLNTACDDSEYVLLFTSVVPPGGDEVSLSLMTSGEQIEDEQPCDECLLGTWTLDNGSYLTHMGNEWPIITAMLPSLGLSTDGVSSSLTDVFGVMQITFEEDGTAHGSQEGWGVAGEATGEDGTIHASMTYNGGGEIGWKIVEDEAADLRYLVFENGTFDLSGQMIFQTIPQRPIPFTNSNDSVFLSTTQAFLCSEETLTYYADDALGPVVFRRGTGEGTSP